MRSVFSPLQNKLCDYGLINGVPSENYGGCGVNSRIKGTSIFKIPSPLKQERGAGWLSQVTKSRIITLELKLKLRRINSIFEKYMREEIEKPKILLYISFHHFPRVFKNLQQLFCKFRIFLWFELLICVLLKSWELLKIKLEQLSNISFNIFHPQIFFQLKQITLFGKCLKIK